MSSQYVELSKFCQWLGVVCDAPERGSDRVVMRFRGAVKEITIDEMVKLGRVGFLTMVEDWKNHVHMGFAPSEPRGPTGDEVSREISAIRKKLELAYDQYSKRDYRGAYELLQQMADHVMNAESFIYDQHIRQPDPAKPGAIEPGMQIGAS